MTPFVSPPELPTPDPGKRDNPVWQIVDLLAAIRRNIFYW